MRKYIIIELIAKTTDYNSYTFGEILDEPFCNFEDAEIAANEIVNEHKNIWVTIIPIYVID